jgi:hypothetical protein
MNFADIEFPPNFLRRKQLSRQVITAYGCDNVASIGFSATITQINSITDSQLAFAYFSYGKSKKNSFSAARGTCGRHATQQSLRCRNHQIKRAGVATRPHRPTMQSLY